MTLNSIQNKFFHNLYLVYKHPDVFAITETGLDSSFPESKFLIEEIKNLYILCVSDERDGLLAYVKKDSISKYHF